MIQQAVAIAMLLLAFPAGAIATEVVIARVNGQPITEGALVAAATEHQRERMTPAEFDAWQEQSRNKLLVMAIRGPLIAAYAERAGLGATAEEKAAAMAPMRADAVKSKSVTGVDPDSEAMVRLRGEWVERSIREIKVGEALWRQHGGSCGFGSLGSCTPFEAQVAFFKAEVEANRLEFLRPATERRFWEAIVDRRQLADVVLDDPQKIEGFFKQIRDTWRPVTAEPR